MEYTVPECARRIYAAAGLQLIETATQEDFGTPVQGEPWLLDLGRLDAARC